MATDDAARRDVAAGLRDWAQRVDAAHLRQFPVAPAPDIITAASDLAAVVYYAFDIHARNMDAGTLALWKEAAEISRRIHADARKGGQ